MSTTINAGTTCYVTANCRDAAGVLAVPASLNYSIIEIASNTVIVDNGSIAPVATAVIEIPPSQSQLLSAERNTERRRVVVTATYGADDAVTEYYHYSIRRV